MSTDYFAHGVYGIVLPEDDQKLLNDRMSAADGETWGESAAAVKKDRELRGRLARKHGAPPDARLHYTGSDDDRPGRCDADANLWLLGHGMPAFPLPADLPPAWKEKADWHTWVEAG